MKIVLVTPAPGGSLKGNRITALRWARLLRGLGHSVSLRQQYHRGECDLLVALHARRSHDSIRRYRQRYPRGPLVVTLTGTDLYGGLEEGPEALQSLEWADRIVVLHALAGEALPPPLRGKVRVVYQSVPAAPRREPVPDSFQVCVMGHLREVKDPLRAALAARLLPPTSRLRVLHLGAALSPEMESQARAEIAVSLAWRAAADRGAPDPGGEPSPGGVVASRGRRQRGVGGAGGGRAGGRLPHCRERRASWRGLPRLLPDWRYCRPRGAPPPLGDGSRVLHGAAAALRAARACPPRGAAL